MSEFLARWIEERRSASGLSARRIPLSACPSWRRDDGRIVHRDGAFFSVVGVRSSSNDPGLDGVEQPMILQPEIGILGFLVRHPGEEPEVLVQAKAEPGNVGEVHLAPTVQATESNYRRRHGGAPTEYLEFFTGAATGARTLADSLQSEQGTRFFGKYNRNATVSVSGLGPEPAGDSWRWVPVGDLLAALHADFAVNTDARSTLVGSDWRALCPDGRPFEVHRGRGGFGEALLRSFEVGTDPAPGGRERLAAMAAAIRIETSLGPLDGLRGWTLTDDGIRSANGAGFEVRYYDVRCAGREVERWDQPLAAGTEESEAVLLCRRRDGVLRFLFRGSFEIGFAEGVQLGPTAQTGLPSAGAGDLAAFALAPPAATVRADVRQSDEGGRFWRSVVRYRVVEVPEDEPLPRDPLAAELTLAQARRLTREKGVFTNEARSLLSLLLPWLGGLDDSRIGGNASPNQSGFA